jgi:hypothetical protein
MAKAKMIKTSICMSRKDLELIRQAQLAMNLESRSKFFRLACKNLVTKIFKQKGIDL